MSQNDYKESVEEHRQSIEVEGDKADSKPSRMARKQQQRPNNRAPKKNWNNTWLTVIAVIFIMIPVSTLIYFYVLNPSNDSADGVKADSENVLIENNDSDGEKPTNDNETTEKPTADSSANADKADVEENKDVAAAKAAKEKEEQEAKALAAKEKAQAEKEAKEKAAKEKAAKEKAEKEKTEPVVQSAAYLEAIRGGYLHNAVEGDTIQSISTKYYGSEAYVEKIKQLNGISADRVPAGTKVALIKP